jgi:beta-glucosidase
VPADGTLRFPAGFLWGAATAAHQVEGGNVDSDWWEWERLPGTPCREPSGWACEHYTRYPADVALLAELGFNCYRYSVEWARIQPSPDDVDSNELEHYREMTKVVRDAGLTPVVTLNHFTLPRWVAARGGWCAPEVGAWFERYADIVTRALGDRVEWWCTLNEPGGVAMGGYLGVFGWPPGRTDFRSWERAVIGMRDAHRRARELIKAAWPDAQVGMTHAMQEWTANDAGRAVMETVRAMAEDALLDICGNDDFVGVQTYTRLPGVLSARLGRIADFVSRHQSVKRKVLPVMMRRMTDAVRTADGRDRVRRTQMGYEFRPEAIGVTLRRAADKFPGKPLLVTEHGIATADDEERVEFIDAGLHAVHAAMADGVPVRGYIHWSLLDNFEWVYGYRPTFGLIGVDRVTQARTVRPSARHLGAIARANRLGQSR